MKNDFLKNVVKKTMSKPSRQVKKLNWKDGVVAKYETSKAGGRIKGWTKVNTTDFAEWKNDYTNNKVKIIQRHDKYRKETIYTIITPKANVFAYTKAGAMEKAMSYLREFPNG